MDELNSHARTLLNAANSFDDPTDADRDRVRAAVLMRVGSVAAVGTATIAAAKASSAAASAGPLLASTLTSAAFFSGAAVKLGAVVVIGPPYAGNRNGCSAEQNNFTRIFAGHFLRHFISPI